MMTQAGFKLMGLLPSPYTMKVDAFLKFKGIPFEWITRSMKNEPLFQKHAKVQLIPLVFFPNGETMQDSTHILERLDKEYPEPSIHPKDEVLWFMSCLFEEFGDEWCNKLMFFQRWFYKADAKNTGDRLAYERLEGTWYRPLAHKIYAKAMVKRMIPRLSYSGGNEVNIPQLKQSFEDVTEILDMHFATRPYLFGGRPCFGDFGLWCNLYQAWTDPTAHAYIEANTPNLKAYIERMLHPAIEGGFEPVASLRPTLDPLLSSDFARRFLPWMDANHNSFEAGSDQTKLIMNGSKFTQKTFKYQAKTLDELRRKYQSVAANTELKTWLKETGCLPFLSAA
ncbi:MAG: glutathione S-transferase family protein [Pseudomonadota bacterium]